MNGDDLLLAASPTRRIAAVLKHTSLHPISRNNDDLLLHGRHHYIQLDPGLAPQGRRRMPPLPQSALKKVADAAVPNRMPLLDLISTPRPPRLCSVKKVPIVALK